MNLSATSATSATSAASAVSAAPATPESELAPLLAAWDQAHSATTDDLEWRHLLDEMAHPRTTQAFYRLAVAGG